MSKVKLKNTVKLEYAFANIAGSEEFPDTLKSAYFAYAPSELEEGELRSLQALFEANEAYAQMIAGMRRDRQWLAPQFGLPPL